VAGIVFIGRTHAATPQEQTMTEFSRQALVADIGHTNMRFALADIDELTIRDFAIMSTPMFSGAGEALEAYLRTVPDRPSMVAVSVAGPVAEGRARLSRSIWSFAVEDIRNVIDAEVCLINEIEGLAQLLPHLVEHDVHNLGGLQGDPQAPKLVVGVGTTVSLAGLVPTTSEPVVIGGQSEAIAFACQSEREAALVRAMPHQFPYAAAGDVLSASGLVALHKALKGATADTSSAADIVHAALAHQDQAAKQAVEQFISWLGGFAADMTLAYGAAGGVYLAGGMPRAMLEVLQSGLFRAAFEARGDAAEMLAGIPVNVITAPDACLRAAALAASRALREGGPLASAA